MKINKSNYENKKGITLIALVITIIVLIILASVSIYLLLGENGLITRARQASEEYKKAEEDEKQGLNSLDEQINNQIGGGTSIQAGDEVTKPDEYKDEDNVKAITDGQGNTIPVPSDFYYAGGTKDTGFVISDVENDDLDNSQGGNQFVWIPVDTIGEYARTDFGVQYGQGSGYSEEIDSVEYTSVEKYKGYYIGRFEAGDNQSTLAETYRNEYTSDTNIVTVKKGQVPYNYLTIAQSKTLAEEMKITEGYSATTKLVSSYAWDTAINFIQKTNSDYALSSEEGNYKNSTTFTYVDITGESKSNENEISTLNPTGQTTAVSNIYDMGGNVWEWNSETYTLANCIYVVRGGSCYDEYTNYPAGYRSYGNDTNTYDNMGFRVTLFM